jgi:hypothetical protein
MPEILPLYYYYYYIYIYIYMCVCVHHATVLLLPFCMEKVGTMEPAAVTAVAACFSLSGHCSYGRLPETAAQTMLQQAADRTKCCHKHYTVVV